MEDVSVGSCTASNCLFQKSSEYHFLDTPTQTDLQLANDHQSQPLVVYSAKTAATNQNPWFVVPVKVQTCTWDACTTHHWSAVHSERHPFTWTVARHYHYAVHILRLRDAALDLYSQRSLSLKQRAQFVSMAVYMQLALSQEVCKSPFQRLQHMSIATSLQASGLGSLKPNLLKSPLQSSAKRARIEIK